MGEHKNFARETYHLKPLPLELGKEVIAKSREFLAFLEHSGASTHPDVREIHRAVSTPLATLVGQVEAQKVQEAGGGRDEMDAWLDAGVRPAPVPEPE